jgi:hypothetical protein
MQSVESIEPKLRQRTHEDAKRLLGRKTLEQLRIEAVDTFQHEHVPPAQLDARASGGLARARREIEPRRADEISIDEPTKVLLQEIDLNRFERLEVELALLVSRGVISIAVLGAVPEVGAICR